MSEGKRCTNCMTHRAIVEFVRIRNCREVENKMCNKCSVKFSATAKKYHADKKAGLLPTFVQITKSGRPKIEPFKFSELKGVQLLSRQLLSKPIVGVSK